MDQQFLPVQPALLPDFLVKDASIDGVLFDVIAERPAGASKTAWCDRFRLGETPFFCIVAMILKPGFASLQTVFFSDRKEFTLPHYSVADFGALLDHAKHIYCYHQSYCYMLLHKPYSLTTHAISPSIMTGAAIPTVKAAPDSI